MRAGPDFLPPVRSRLAFTHANVVPMTENAILADHTVIVDGGVISKVEPSSEIGLDGATEIYTAGSYLMPGLADMHVHYWDIGEFAMFLANGVTLVRNMWGSPFHLALQRRIADRDFPGPRVVTTSPIIDGPGPNGTTIWPNSALAADTETAGSLVRSFAKRGYEQTKAYSWLKLDVLQALGEASKEAGIRMVGHCPDGITYEEAIDAGMSCFEHLTGIAEGRLAGKSLLGMRAGSIEAMRTVVDNLDLDAIRRLAHMLAKKEIWNCPTLVVWQGMAQEESVAMSNPLLRYEPPALAAGWNPANDFRFRNTSVDRSGWLAVALARIELYRRIISILHEEGAPLLLGTDTPNPFVFQGFSIHDELENLVQSGLSPIEALRAGTAEAARFLDEGDEWGTVAVGKRADLLLLAANPLEDVSAVRRPEAVCVNGYFFSRADLDEMLKARAAAVSAGSGAPPPSLDGATATTARVRAEGVLRENLAGIEGGAFRFRIARRDDGGLLVDESRSSSADGLHSWGGVSHSRVELTPSLHIGSATVRNESFLGVESCDIRWDGETYDYRVTEIDGHQTQGRLPGPLYPSEELAFASLLPLANADGLTEGTHRAMAWLESGPGEITMTVSREADGEVRLSSDKHGTVAEQNFRFDSGGCLVDMEELTWRGMRRVTPAGENEA
jgi:imidazolonepropionase-like amidohydrolase